MHVLITTRPRHRYDALGSIAFGFSLCAVSFVLVSKNRRLLLGQSMESKRLAAVIALDCIGSPLIAPDCL